MSCWPFRNTARTCTAWEAGNWCHWRYVSSGNNCYYNSCKTESKGFCL